ncbi:hypothetical protein [Vibrio coralliilyticus]|uniref:hypothetical protein n=1 Tax=Vibrio coralliilyticus TaxID=190893 RepID=UPI000361F96F|nr:hypothetical protein [Vibrio coralliilyticus]
MVTFLVKDLLNETIDYFRVSVDDISQKAERNRFDSNIFEANLRFLHLCDLQTLMWDKNLESKWLRAMDYIIGWLYPTLEHLVESIDKKSPVRHDKISELHDDIEGVLGKACEPNEEALLVYSIYRKLYQYNQRKWALY